MILNAYLTRESSLAKDSLFRTDQRRGKHVLTSGVDVLAIAAKRMARERPGHTLQPAPLTNKAYLRVADNKARKFCSQRLKLAVALA